MRLFPCDKTDTTLFLFLRTGHPHPLGLWAPFARDLLLKTGLDLFKAPGTQLVRPHDLIVMLPVFDVLKNRQIRLGESFGSLFCT